LALGRYGVRVVRDSPFLEGPGPLAFAHRGGAAEAQENSRAAFERAASMGFRYMETDVRATADGVAVAMHDRTLERLTGESGAVNEITWSELQRRHLQDGSQIPRLEDLLAAWPELRWNIDVKHRRAVSPVVAAVERTNSRQRVLMASFSGRRTAAVRRGLGNEVATGAGRWTVALLVAAKVAPFARLHTSASAAQVPVARRGIHIVDKRFVHTCHQAGVAVHVWTVDERSEIEELLDLGVDGIMTDRPSVLKEVLVARGQWAGST
jgi:glycerophosphoryl diester phosphodiesterase